jgi:hypothetical protein
MRISRQPSPVQIMIDQKQVQNMEYLNCSGSVIAYDERCTRGIKSRIAVAKAAIKKKNILFTSKFDLNLRKTLVKRYVWSLTFYSAETWTLRKADQKYLENFEMW